MNDFMKMFITGKNNVNDAENELNKFNQARYKEVLVKCPCCEHTIKVKLKV